MEKVICVIVDECVAFWQAEVIKRLQSKEIKLYALKSQQRYNDSFFENFVFTLEKKLLKSSDKFLKKDTVHHFFEQTVVYIDDISEVNSCKEVNYCISFVSVPKIRTG